MFFSINLDPVLRAPGQIAKEASKAASQIPAVPFDVADKAREGMEEGNEKLTSPDERTGD